MLKKISILLLILIFVLTWIYLVPHEKHLKVGEIISPCKFFLGEQIYTIPDVECFDSCYSEKNKKFAKKLQITEDEAFILGNLGKYWAENIISGRIIIKDKKQRIIFNKNNYSEKFKRTAFCLNDEKPCAEDLFTFYLHKIRKTKYCVLDLDTDEIYKIGDERTKNLKNFLVLRKSHLAYRHKKHKKNTINKKIITPATKYENGNIKIYLTDFTTKYKPDINCTTDVCKELLSSINNAKNSIDIAIYGYQKVPAIENALKNAIARGVKLRLVCDSDSKGENIYADTNVLKNLISENRTDYKSKHPNQLMHNKFYIFDNKKLITGSINLSPTDMSGFNSNAMIVINSEEIAQVYKTEFEEMFNGKFHDKNKIQCGKEFLLDKSVIKAGFSPQDKITSSMIIPLINGAKHYIYMPIFLITDTNLTDALINAQKRGVEVKIIADALNASKPYSKHKNLRQAGISVKTENYAGKMHSKSILIDDTYTVLGSMNFSNSGENKNDENVLVIKNAEITNFYKKFFLYQWNKIDDKWLKYNAPAEGKSAIGSCSDGIDNNYDGKIDSEDVRCK